MLEKVLSCRQYPLEGYYILAAGSKQKPRGLPLLDHLSPL